MEQSIAGFDLSRFLTPEGIAQLMRAGVFIIFGVPLVYFLSKWVKREIGRRYTPQHGLIAGKLVSYTGYSLVIASVLHQLKFGLGPLLGTAGVIGVAVAFASQTSVSNIISGLFLVAEQPFVVGDLVTIGGTTGQVLSIDMLSVKLRTFDNKFVRIPNEHIIKSELWNVTRFPIRRLDIAVGVAYKEDISKVRRVLLEVARGNPLALQEPEPLVIFSGFGGSSVDLQFAVWVEKSNYIKLKNSIQEEIKQRFDEEGIEIPFPHLSLYAGSVTEPFPVRIMENASGGRPSSQESGNQAG